MGKLRVPYWIWAKRQARKFRLHRYLQNRNRLIDQVLNSKCDNVERFWLRWREYMNVWISQRKWAEKRLADIEAEQVDFF